MKPFPRGKNYQSRFDFYIATSKSKKHRSYHLYFLGATTHFDFGFWILDFGLVYFFLILFAFIRAHSRANFFFYISDLFIKAYVSKAFLPSNSSLAQMFER